MGYEGARLAPAFGTGPVKVASREMARRGGAAWTVAVRAKTPIDTGELEASWREKIVLISLNDVGEVVYESGPYTETSYAPDVEYGTGLWGPKHAKYLIEPKNPDGVLHWIGKDGESVFARRVWHPGSPGAHMLAISGAETEAAMQELLAPVLEAWVKAQELEMKEGQAR